MTFATAFVQSYIDRIVRKYYPASVYRRINIELDGEDNSITLTDGAHDPLVISQWMQYEPRGQWMRYTSYRIDLWLNGAPDPESPDEWYAREVKRMSERAPA